MIVKGVVLQSVLEATPEQQVDRCTGQPQALIRFRAIKQSWQAYVSYIGAGGKLSNIGTAYM